jgi:hypothetical protein
MKKLRLGFTDTIKPFEDFFVEVLSREYDIERDDENPDYLIFGDRNFGTNNTQPKYKRDGLTRIFFTGENQRPAQYDCHASFSFDHDSRDNYRLPLFVIYDWDNKRKGVRNADSEDRDIMDVFGKERGFCSFVVKNGGCEMRNAFFHKLNEYKKVDSAGPLFNNIGYVLEGGERAVQAKAALLPKYKFNLCFENSSYPWYATEKLFEALCFKTVPIYWGSPTIECDFNPQAFLNWHDYQDSDRLIERIKELDTHEGDYTNMYLEPMFNWWKKPKVFDLDRLVFWFGKYVYRG